MCPDDVLVPRRVWLRRLAAFALSALAVGTTTELAWAGSYLDRAALLVKEARTEAEYLGRRLDSKELAELVHRLATARLASARDMIVPKEVVEAHPHLLLMLENYERAADAAESSARERFITLQRKARDEEEIFRSIMRQLGFPLDDEKKR